MERQSFLVILPRHRLSDRDLEWVQVLPPKKQGSSNTGMVSLPVFLLIVFFFKIRLTGYPFCTLGTVSERCLLSFLTKGKVQAITVRVRQPHKQAEMSHPK